MEKYLLMPQPGLQALHVGKKGERLNWLYHLGFPVPPLCFVTTSAYNDFIVHNKLKKWMDEILASIDTYTTNDRLKEELKTIQQAIIKGEIPPLMEKEINGSLKILQDLLGEKLAIRSSGVFEDLLHQSYAGQFDTLLDVVCEPLDITQAIKQVWASGWNESHLIYLMKNRQPQKDFSIAVILQKMVTPDFSGVLFTKSPFPGYPGSMCLEYVTGRGENLVGGRSTPHQIIIHRDTGKFEERIKPEGVKARIPSEVTKKIVQLGVEIEERSQMALDMEWSVEGDQIYILQIRPLTSVPREPEILWTDENVGEVIPDVVTPLSWSLLEPITNYAFNSFLQKLSLKKNHATKLVTLYSGKVYFNHTAFNNALKKFYLSENLKSLPKQHTVRAWMEVIWHCMKFFFRAGKTTILISRLPAQMDKDLKEHKKILEMFKYKKDLHPEKHFQMIESLWSMQKKMMSNHVACTIFGEIYYQLLHKLSHIWVKSSQPETVEQLLKGLTETESVQVGKELWNLAKRISTEPGVEQIFNQNVEDIINSVQKLPPEQSIRKEIDLFLEKFGHCALHEFELLYPRWKEDPKFVYNTLKTYLEIHQQDQHFTDPFKTFDNHAQKILQFLNGVEGRFRFLKRILLKHVVKKAILFSEKRESLKQGLIRLHFELKKHILRIGRYFQNQNLVENQTDVFYLQYAELVAAFGNPSDSKDWQEIIHKRKLEREKYLSISHPRRLYQIQDRWIPEWDEFSGKASKTLMGIGCSPGRVEGYAHVICSDQELTNFQKGEILVTRYTNPGWVPILQLAAGVVTEIGGALSHGAIIVREYGIPMVAAVEDVTKLVRSGDKIRIDGYSGRVEILEKIWEDSDAPGVDASQ